MFSSNIKFIIKLNFMKVLYTFLILILISSCLSTNYLKIDKKKLKDNWANDKCGEFGVRKVISNLLTSQPESYIRGHSKEILEIVGNPDTIINTNKFLKYGFVVGQNDCNVDYLNSKIVLEITINPKNNQILDLKYIAFTLE